MGRGTYRLKRFVDHSSVRTMLYKFEAKKAEIDQRLKEFSEIDKSDRERIFEELAFCLLTPQSSARYADIAIRRLKDKGLLFNGSPEEVAKLLTGVRFHNTKARRIVEARDAFESFTLELTDNKSSRDKLVQQIKGIGYKEASHFLRNIGLGEKLAILDRHILKNLVKLGVIEETPVSISPKRYLEIEDKMRRFCAQTGISMAQLDLFLWSKETGEVFK